MIKETQIRFRRLKLLLLALLAILPGVPAVAQTLLVLTVRHDHAWGSCLGTLTFDDRGVKYVSTHTKDARTWTYEDVQQFQVEEDRRLRVFTYEDRKWRLGADKVFVFDWSGLALSGVEGSEATPEEVYRFLEAHTHRPIAAWLRPSDLGEVRFEFPAKHLGFTKGREGHLVFTNRHVSFQSKEDSKDENGDRTWRYEDLEGVSSSGLYDLTLTTYERQRMQYASRRVYRFQLKEALRPDRYDELWRFVNEQKTED